MQGVRTVVTGATGKVGRRLVGALLRVGAEVAILTRQPAKARELWPAGAVECRAADLTEAASLEPTLAGRDLVFHLASYSPAPGEPDIYEAPLHWPITAGGTRNLVAAAVPAGVRSLIYLSSVKAMGDAAASGAIPADESVAPAPDTLYGRAKLEAERLVLGAGAGHSLHTSVLRLPMVYGLDGEGNIARMIDAIARNRFPPWPRIENRRSAVHVDDAIRAALLAASRSRAAGETYLVTDGEAYSTRWLYEQILIALGRRVPGWTLPLWILKAAAGLGSAAQRVTGRAIPLTRTGLGKLTGNAWYSSEKIRRDLGFEPSHRLAEEIPRMVREYQSVTLTSRSRRRKD
jgi:nucleoside-diphosphate-sugar epimerase